MNEFLKIIFGNQTLAGFSGNLVLATVGIIARLMYNANTRNPASPNTPTDFSIGFLFKDNALRLFSSFVGSLFLVLIAVRFCSELLQVQLNPFIAVMIGYSSDTLAEKLKETAKSSPTFATDTTTFNDQVIDPEKPAAEQAKVEDENKVDQKVIVDKSSTGNVGQITATNIELS